MLSAFRIKNEKYYTALANANYYEEGGESLGVWHGKGAQTLGLTGTVNTEQLSCLLEGFCPHGSGKKLLQNAGKKVESYRKEGTVKTREREVGFDVTMSAPKSVSVAWALADEKTGKLIQRCHDRAVATTLDLLEEQFAHTRRGKGGKTLEKTRIVVAQFRHGTSRYVDGNVPDPQLHTHCLVAKASVRKDGTTGALLFSAYPRRNGQEGLLQAQKLLGGAYRLELSRQIQQQLGYDITRTTTERGEHFFEIAGVPSQLCKFFSQRRQQIEAELGKLDHEIDESPALQAAAIALKTRSIKGVIPPRKKLFEQWKAIGVKHEYQAPEATFRFPERQQSLERLQQTMEQVITEQESFSRKQLLEPVVMQAAGTGLSWKEVTALVDARLGRSDIIARSRSPSTTDYCSRTSLQTEEELIQHLVQANVYTTEMSAVKTETDQDLKALESHSSSQDRIGREKTGDVHLVDLGKTQQVYPVIKQAQSRWHQRGKKAVGVAPGVQAYRMQQETGIKSASPEWFTLSHELGEHPLHQDHIVVVNRPDQLRKKQLLNVLTLARKAKASVLLIGGGKFLRSLASAVMRERQRQQRKLAASIAAHEREQTQQELQR